MFIICVVFVLINYCNDFLHLYCLYNSEQDISKELINKRLDNCNFKNWEDKRFFAYASQIRGGLRKIGIKEKSVFRCS
ncbi:hypothetical protein CNO14_07165 (plasmid) [Borrelia miyamotoi]|nr:hypothetical protein [Borrelia miyamotoi]QDA32747.2 hypothetical protein CNO09_06865 [Borrelia miyamotoi]WAZ71131.1 hypothetical protein O5403_05240 [Borrelia miyamotoi]WCB91073.1 hypothetical protein CNO11_06870 [Borrelia miyamotoi]WCL22176.1 hypothetical protein CNO10_07350 [Borrelia miyamotoi]WDE70464.1 hypothetical protein CNO12_07505 [Borrelia miyamotoi]